VAHVQGPASTVGASSSSLNRTFASDVTAGNLITAHYSNWKGSTVLPTGCSDGLSNSYSTAVTNNPGASAATQMRYAENISGGACTVTMTVSSTDWCFAVNEYTGIVASSSVHTTGNNNGSSTTPSVSLTPTVPCQIVAHMGMASATTITPDGDYNERQETQSNSTANISVLDRTPISSSETVDWTIGASAAWSAVAAAFQLVTVDQSAFRWGEDDGSESAHTWAAAENTNLTEEDNRTNLLRIQLEATDNPPSAAYVLRYQKNGSGGYSVVNVGSTTEVTPVIEAGDCTVSGNNTAEDPWAVSHPAAVTGDLLLFYVAWDDSTTTTTVTAPSGPNGETLTSIEGPVTDTSTETRAQLWYTVATGSWSASTVSFNPNATESWTATVVKIPAGEFESADPIGASANAAATSTSDTTIDSPAFTAGSTDGGGKLLVFNGIDADPMGSAPSGWTNLQTQDLGAVAHGVAARTAAVTDSESVASAAWSIAGDSWTSIAVIVRAPTVTNEVYIATSSNIASGGEATTARLSVPGGKSFTTGRRWDDENGTDSIDIGSSYYTELEWAVALSSAPATNDYYEFRVYQGTSPLSAYDYTPKWTVGTAGVSVSATKESLTLAEYAATVTVDVNVNASTEALTLQENAATVAWGVNVSASTDALALAEYSASVVIDHDIQASKESLTLAENQATVSVDINVSAATESLVLAEYPANVSLDVAVSGTTEALVLAEYPATVDVGSNVSVAANVESLVLSTYPATVDVEIPVVSRGQGAGRIIGYLPEYPKKKKKEPVIIEVPDLSRDEELARLIRKDAEYRKSKQEEYDRLIEVLRVSVHLTNHILLSQFQYLEHQDIERARRKIQREEEEMLLLFVA
jgi:hypothetical protein